MGHILKETNVSFEIRRKLIVLLEKKMVPRTEIKTSSLDPPKIKQQAMTVTGMVTDQQNVPLGGVSIVIRGTTKGVSTNFDGQYEIEVSEGDILVFSYIGFASREVTVKQEKSINVTLFQICFRARRPVFKFPVVEVLLGWVPVLG